MLLLQISISKNVAGCIWMYICIYKHTSIHTYILHAYTHLHTQIYLNNIYAYVCIHICMCTHTYTYSVHMDAYLQERKGKFWKYFPFFLETYCAIVTTQHFSYDSCTTKPQDILSCTYLSQTLWMIRHQKVPPPIHWKRKRSYVKGMYN